jgi:hypothetical protein
MCLRIQRPREVSTDDSMREKRKANARSVLDAAVEREALLAVEVVLEELLAVARERRRRVDLWRTAVDERSAKRDHGRSERRFWRTLDELVQVLCAVVNQEAWSVSGIQAASERGTPRAPLPTPD